MKYASTKYAKTVKKIQDTSNTTLNSDKDYVIAWFQLSTLHKNLTFVDPADPLKVSVKGSSEAKGSELNPSALNGSSENQNQHTMTIWL